MPYLHTAQLAGGAMPRQTASTPTGIRTKSTPLLLEPGKIGLSNKAVSEGF